MAERRQPVEPLVKHCAVPGCTNDASWGFGVSLLRGVPGRWYCAPHRDLGNDAAQARAPPAKPGNGPAKAHPEQT